MVVTYKSAVIVDSFDDAISYAACLTGGACVVSYYDCGETIWWHYLEIGEITMLDSRK